MQEHGLLGIHVLWFERAEKGPGFKSSADWDHDVAATTTNDLPTITGWWIGEDIVWLALEDRPDNRPSGRTGSCVELAQTERGEDRKLLWSAFQEAGVAAPDVSVPADISPQNAPVDEALAIYPLEGLLALAEMPNLPGSINEHPNWRRRLAVPVSELFDDDSFVDRLLAVDQARQKSARTKAATTHNVSPTD
ncbi:MAG: 4-alpha-glucanotransferase (amylomaltase) (EC [uncultured Caballeronia sp.]|nr:MAG: 4-alpha-glucanotransferase (amylomaltase) (EC [uncultured Caballeronia sp.]